MSVFLTVVCLGCLSEKGIDPARPDTFIKYYNGGANDEAEDMKVTSDGGFILLATSKVSSETSRSKIKIIKTDPYGTVEWSRVYPPFDQPGIDTGIADEDNISFSGSSIEIIKDGSGADMGYVIVGDSIHLGNTSESYLRIMTTDLNGNQTRAKNLKPSFAVRGDAVAVNQNGNFLVLGSAINAQETTNMFLAEISPAMDNLWSRTYGAGSTNLTRNLFVDANSSVYWSGTVNKSNSPSNIRFVKTPPNSENTEHDLELGKPDFSETGNDICTYGIGYAILGTTNESISEGAVAESNLLFKWVASDGITINSKIYGNNNLTQQGLALARTKGGGFILFGSVETNLSVIPPVGRGGKDYLLIKIDPFGETEWTQTFGSINEDIGSSVTGLPDGSLVMFGTTTWAGLQTLSLIKTDPLGNIQ